MSVLSFREKKNQSICSVLLRVTVEGQGVGVFHRTGREIVEAHSGAGAELKMS